MLTIFSFQKLVNNYFMDIVQNMKINLKKNIGTPDRLIRLTIGILLLIFAYLQMSWILLIFGLFTLFESFMSWCIFYQLIGRNTCPLKKRK